MISSESFEPTRATEIDALASIGAPAPSQDLWSRVTTSIEHDVRPMADPFRAPESSLVDEGDVEVATHRAFTGWTRIAAAAACAVIGVMMLRPTTAIEAGMISGAMTLSPAMPKAGQVVQVRYTAGAALGRPATLRLRARVRTVHGENYVTNEPVITAGSLQRVDGTLYTGSFTMPDSIVYAALAVEDGASIGVDDFGGRTWEVLRAGADGEPTLAALEQRTNDLMGRSWEQGLLGVRRMIRLYPDSVQSWRWLSLYESWMALSNDSTRAAHRQRLARFTARDLHNATLSAEDISDMVWYARSLDSTTAESWMARLLREAPTHSTAVYLRGLDALQGVWAAKLDTASALKTLESLWPSVPQDRREWLAGYGGDFAAHDTARAAVWAERMLAASRSTPSRRAAAMRLLDMPSQRVRGENALRELLKTSTARSERRLLDESAAAHAARVERMRRTTLAALGKALAADGKLVAARDTLERATAGGWDIAAYGTLADVYLKLGDTTRAVSTWANVAVDPRTAPSRKAALDSAAKRVGALHAWPVAQRASRIVMADRVLERAINRHVDDVQLTKFDGTTSQLSNLRGAQATVVLFWSHECGYAIEAVPELQALRRQLETKGIPFVWIADANRVTPELVQTLKEKKVQEPVYLDATGKATATFNNWGTPMLYVLDSKGRVAFPGTSEQSQILLYAEALKSANR